MQSAITSFDRMLCRRALCTGTISVLFLALVGSVTEERAGSAGAPLARIASFAPLAGALGAWLAAQSSRVRGELRALAALGVSPTRSLAGAVAGGVAVGVLGPLLAASAQVDLSPLFPALRVTTRALRALGPDRVELAPFGVVLRSTGDLEWSGAGQGGALGPAVAVASGSHRAATVAALAWAAVILPAWAASREAVARAAGAGGLFALVTVATFHLVANGRAPSLALLVGPLVLCADLALGRYESARRRRSDA